MLSRMLTISAAAAVAAAATAGSIASASTTGDDHVQRIVVQAATTSFHYIDVGPAGISPGDSTTFTKRLKNLSGKVVGSAAGMCVILTTRPGSEPVKSDECQQTFTFTGRGALQVDGLEQNPSRPGPGGFAIVGGTGRFRQAEGQLLPGAGPGGSNIFEVIS
jgi:hypothetical protein